MVTDFLCYIESFIDRIGIPSEAKDAILSAEKKIFSDERTANVFSGSKTEFYERQAQS
jgi:hypothetical protein